MNKTSQKTTIETVRDGSRTWSKDALNKDDAGTRIEESIISTPSDCTPCNHIGIISLNVRGFAVKGKFGWVRNICFKERPCIAVLQETKCKPISDQWVQSLWGDSNFGYMQKEAVGKSGRLLVIWDKSVFDVESSSCCEFFLAIRGRWKMSGEDSTIVNVYGPHNDRSKKLMWRLLDKLINSVNYKCLLCGDFNEVWSSSDRLNSQFHQGRADRFNEFILVNNLIEIPISGRKFSRISDDGLKFSKLDRDRVIDYGPKPFKVFDEWFNCLDVDVIIREAWEQPIRGTRKDCAFSDRLNNVNLDNEIKELKKEAMDWELKAEFHPLSDLDRASWLDCRRRWVEKENVKMEDLVAALNWFWSTGEISEGCNASFITLTPKKTDPVSLHDYRPISLIGSYYKIIVKWLSLRIRKVRPSLVGFEQSAFIRGRNIMDGALIANESFEFLKIIA
ncbi:uncharacterized protein [Rutidosis leptorrhynchoides]|uniref:uncharacterized protein n=1 Tax=Rutidosis leptorrhynchoides TaxID=125765 RepID=UPI003A99FD8D